MSSDEDAVDRFVNTGDKPYYDAHSNNNALSAYLSKHRSAQYDHYASSSSSDSNHHNSGAIHERDDVSSIGSAADDHSEHKQSLNIFNPSSPSATKDTLNDEHQSLLQKDAKKDMHGRILRQKVMRNHKYSALKSIHIWFIVGVTSLDHLLRKLYEYFAFPIATLLGLTFQSMGYTVAALDVAAILSSSLILPFVISKSPHLMQFTCQLLIGLSMLFMVWWSSFLGLLVLRFVFGVGYILLLSNWSVCISTFVSPSKQSAAIGRIDLSWAFASFFFILCAYVLDNYGLAYIFYILSVLAILCALVLFMTMPSQKLITAPIHRHNCGAQMANMLRLIFCQHLPTAVFLGVVGLVTLVNSALTLLLAPWLMADYSLTITEFGYCTVIIGTSQVVAIIFSYQFGNRLGVGWSLVAGILVQCLMFVLILLLGSGGLLWSSIVSATDASSSSSHYTFPLLLILLILAIHFIAAEFTYINAVSCMLHIAPVNVISSKTVAANAMRLVTSVCRIAGAVLAPWLWAWEGAAGSFRVFSLLAVIALGAAFVMDLALMLYIACFVWDADAEEDAELYLMVSSEGGGESGVASDESEDLMFAGDKDYHTRPEDEMDDEYIAKILSTNIDFTLL